MSVPINLSKLYEIDRSHMFITLEEPSAEKLEKYPSIIARLKNSLYFIQHGGSHDKDRINSAFIRSSLCELVSIEDLQRELGLEVLQLSSTGSPLLCIARELRNLEIHFNASSISSSRKERLWGNIEDPDKAIETNVEVNYISDLTVERFKNLRNYKNYNPQEFSEALEWFNTNQKEWGIFELLFRAVNEYAKELSIKHG